LMPLFRLKAKSSVNESLLAWRGNQQTLASNYI
jgi:hypothetical protein